METTKICVHKIYAIVQDISSNMEDLILREKRKFYPYCPVDKKTNSYVTSKQSQSSEPVCSHVKCVFSLRESGEVFHVNKQL